MNLVAIALLCQVYADSLVNENCHKYYVECWNKKRYHQLKYNQTYDPNYFLAECVLEKK